MYLKKLTIIKKYFALKYAILLVYSTLSLLMLYQSVKEIYISHSGILIQAEIVKMTEPCGGKNNYADFRFQDKTFNKRVGAHFCEDHSIGTLLPFYHLETFPDDYVFEMQKGTYLEIQLLALLSLIVLFGVCIYYFLFK